jgi:signal transduction histidine kinase
MSRWNGWLRARPRAPDSAEAPALGGLRPEGNRFPEPTNGPFQPAGRRARLLPFAVVALLAEASLALPPGPQSLTALIISLVMLAAVAAGILLLPWSRLPRWATVLVPLGYVGSLLGVIITAGGTGSGGVALMVVPVVWTALFHRPWESAVISAAVAGAVLVQSFFPAASPPGIIVRRVILWAIISGLVSVATHGLRSRIRRSEAAAARLQAGLREVSIARDRDRIASSLHDTVVQRLFSAGLSLQGVASMLATQELRQRVSAVVGELDEASRLLRESIFAIGQGSPGRGLRRSILALAGEMSPVLGTAPDMDLAGPLDTAVPPEVAAPLLVALRTALTVSGASAGATHVSLAVAAGPDEVSMTVSDDGSRWATRTTPAGPALASLREHAAQLGGTVQVSRAGDGGTRLTLRVPLAAGLPAAGMPSAGMPSAELPATEMRAAPESAAEEPGS